MICLKATMEQVAERAGVSKALVSRFINTGAGVSSKNAEKISEAINYFGYHLPGAAAGGEIVMMVNGLSQFHKALIKACSDRALENDYLFTTIECFGEQGRKEKVARLLLKSSVKGIIVYGSDTADKSAIEILSESRVPLILIENDLPEINADKILVNNFAGEYELTKKLIGMGYKSLSMVPWGMSTRAGAERLSGFLAALRDTGIATGNNYILPIERPSFDCALELVEKLVKGGELPEVLVCGDDNTAQLVAAACMRSGLKIPEDISVTGFDGYSADSNTFWAPKLTTMHQPLGEMGSYSISRVFERIENPTIPTETVTFEPEYIKGETTENKLIKGEKS